MLPDHSYKCDWVCLSVCSHIVQKCHSSFFNHGRYQVPDICVDITSIVIPWLDITVASINTNLTENIKILDRESRRFWRDVREAPQIYSRAPHSEVGQRPTPVLLMYNTLVRSCDACTSVMTSCDQLRS